MKTPLILCGLLALSACAAPAPAPQPSPRTSVLRVDDPRSNTDLCFPTAKLAVSAMRMRQHGTPFTTAIAIGRDGSISRNVLEVSDSQLLAAYQYPIMPTAAQKEAVVQKFGADVLNACLYG